MKNLIELAVQRPVAVSMIFGVLFVFGVLSYFRLPIELYPEFESNHITVIVPVRGNWPPDRIEKEVVIPIEEVFYTLSGMTQLESFSQPGKGTIFLTFSAQTSMEYALVEVRESLFDVMSKLSKDVEKPLLAQYKQTDQPVFILSLTSEKQSPESLREWGNIHLKESFLRVQGVGNVELIGGRNKKILVELDTERLNAFQISMEEVLNAIQNSNVSSVVGKIEKGSRSFLIREIGSISQIKELENVVIYKGAEDGLIRLKHLGVIQEGYLQPQSLSRVQYENAVTFVIHKESLANTLEICRRLRELIKNVILSKEKDLQLHIAYDQSVSIEKSLSRLNKSVWLGLVLVCGVLMFAFKSWKWLLLVSVCFPLSLAVCFLGFKLFDVTLNVMSLSGLVLGVGLLSDGAIFVLERIVREYDQTKKLSQAVKRGAGQMAFSLLMSTISVVVVFIPLFYLDSHLKNMFQDLAIAVVLILTVSILISLFLLPAWALIAGRLPYVLHRQRAKYQIAYQQILCWCLSRKKKFVLFLLLSVLTSLVLFFCMEKNFLVSGAENEFLIVAEMPSGTRIEKTNQMSLSLENLLKNYPEIEKVSTLIEGWTAKIWVSLTSKGKSGLSVSKFAEKLSPKIGALGKEMNAFCYIVERNRFKRKEVRFEISGLNVSALQTAAKKVGRVLAKNSHFHAVKVRYKPGRPEVHLIVQTDRLALAGWTPKKFSKLLQAQLEGVIPTRFQIEHQEREVVVHLKEADRDQLKKIRSLILVNSQGVPIALEDLVVFKRALGPSGRWRKNKMPVLEVSAALLGFGKQKQLEQVWGEISNLTLPKNVTVELDEEIYLQKRRMKQLLMALFFSCLLIYLMLAAFFESFLKPLLIMVCIPLGMIGVFPLLFLFGKPVTMGVFVGMILLCGLIVKNAIVILQKINIYILKRETVEVAVKKAGEDSLRPILIASSTTVAGFIPLAVCTGFSETLWSPLSLTLIGGMTTSTMLILFVIPVLVYVSEDLKRKRLKSS